MIRGASMNSPMVQDEAAGSVTECIYRAQQGESLAQHQLWERYLQRLLGIARNRLRGVADAVIDADDVVIKAFHEFLAGVERGQFSKLENRQDLWQILIMLIGRKTIDEKRRANTSKRGAHLRAMEVVEFGHESLIQEFASSDPSPAQAVELSEQFELRLTQLGDEKLRRIALCKMSGFGNQEIARQLGCSLRSIERKLALIRGKWLSELS